MAEKISCFPPSERHGKTIFSFVQYMFEYSVLTAPIVANFFSNKQRWIVLEPNSSVLKSFHPKYSTTSIDAGLVLVPLL